MKTNIFLALGLICLILFHSPLFKPGLIAGHDTGARVIHVQMMAQALKDGQFPVRWVEGPNPGLSHPLFNYYPPFFYYIPSILILLGVSLVPAIYLSLAFFTLIGWLGMYLFIKKLIGDIPAIFSAILFTFTPYRISQLYVRAAYLEFAATSLIPFAFWGILTIFKGKSSTGIIATCVSLALIITLHQPTFIMVLPALFIWIIYLWTTNHDVKKLLLSLFSTGLSLLLAASFVLPLIFESQFIRSSGLASNYFDFHQHFATIAQLIYSPWGYGISQTGVRDGMSFQVGVLNWVAIFAATILIIYHFYQKTSKNSPVMIFFLVIILYGIFMSTLTSLPFWERFSLLGYIQYPWRYLTITTFGSSVLIGYIVPYIQKNYLFVPIIIMVLFNWQYLKPATYLQRDYFTFDSKLFPKNDPMGGLEPSYFPIQVSQTNSDPTIPRFQVIKGKAEIKEMVIKTTLQQFKATVDDYSTIQINTHYFPGWQATINDGKDITQATPGYNNSLGNMELTFTPGEYLVTLRLKDTPIRSIGNYLSLTTTLGLFLLAIFSYKKSQNI